MPSCDASLWPNQQAAHWWLELKACPCPYSDIADVLSAASDTFMDTSAHCKEASKQYLHQLLEASALSVAA